MPPAAEQARRMALTVNSTNWGASSGARPPGGAAEGQTQPGAAPLPGQLQRYQLGSWSSSRLGAAAGRAKQGCRGGTAG